VNSPLSILIEQKIPEPQAKEILFWYEKLTDAILLNYKEFISTSQKENAKFLIGINGSQGSGKSTLASVLPDLLQIKGGITADGFSLDDVYKTKAERITMAKKIHPLFATRGVPGTHDLKLAEKTIEAIFVGKGNIPIFDKGSDDRSDAMLWRKICQPSQIAIVEGWCMACPPLPIDNLSEPINQLESEEDKDCIWRNEINQHLRTDYAKFFSQFNYFIHLSIPSFETIFKWRHLQEMKLKEKNPNASNLMNDIELKRFIQHFERITRFMLKTLPSTAHSCLYLNENHEIVNLENRK
jgi:D-glycerate 3-kinase